MRRLRLATRNRLPTRRRAASWGGGRRARQSPEPGAGVVAGQAAGPAQSERRSPRQAGHGRPSGAPPQTRRQTPRLASPQPERRPARNASRAGRAPSRGPAWSQGELRGTGQQWAAASSEGGSAPQPVATRDGPTSDSIQRGRLSASTGGNARRPNEWQHPARAAQRLDRWQREAAQRVAASSEGGSAPRPGRREGAQRAAASGEGSSGPQPGAQRADPASGGIQRGRLSASTGGATLGAPRGGSIQRGQLNASTGGTASGPSAWRHPARAAQRLYRGHPEGAQREAASSEGGSAPQPGATRGAPRGGFIPRGRPSASTGATRSGPTSGSIPRGRLSASTGGNARRPTRLPHQARAAQGATTGNARRPTRLPHQARVTQHATRGNAMRPTRSNARRSARSNARRQLEPPAWHRANRLANEDPTGRGPIGAKGERDRRGQPRTIACSRTPPISALVSLRALSGFASYDGRSPAASAEARPL